jgi:GGDEF domain-containing protein
MGNRLRQTLEALRIPVGGTTLTITVSVGAASLDEGGMTDLPRELLARADGRMYRAKRPVVRVATVT